MMNNIIILAGGVGSRLWPLSTHETPKQFIRFTKDTSLLQMTVKRALHVAEGGCIVIITSTKWKQQVMIELKKFGSMKGSIKVLCEPERKNTTAAIVLGVSWLSKQKSAKAPCMVMASDHLIKNDSAFYENTKQAFKTITSNRNNARKPLVLFGIKPTRAEAGFGYIKASKANRAGVLKVESFSEKPDQETASVYAENPNYWWNSGMFVFDLHTFILLVKTLTPEFYEAFYQILSSTSRFSTYKYRPKFLQKVYSKIPGIPVDKAIIEKAPDIEMVHATFDWSDVGNWLDFINHLKTSTDTTCKPTNNIIYSTKPVIMCEVDNLIVIEGDEGILISSSSSQESLKNISGTFPREKAFS